MFTRGYITWKNMFLMGLSMNLRMLLYVSENWVHRYSHFFMAILSGKLEALDHQILSNVGTLFSNKQGSVTDCYSILVQTYRGIGRSKCANFGLCQILRPLDAFASNCCNWSAAWWVSPRCSLGEYLHAAQTMIVARFYLKKTHSLKSGFVLVQSCLLRWKLNSPCFWLAKLLFWSTVNSQICV